MDNHISKKENSKIFFQFVPCESLRHAQVSELLLAPLCAKVIHVQLGFISHNSRPPHLTLLLAHG